MSSCGRRRRPISKRYIKPTDMFERENTKRNRAILAAMEREVRIMENEVHQRKVDTLRRLISWYEGPFVVHLERYGYVEVTVSDLADDVIVRGVLDGEDWYVSPVLLDTIISRLASGEVFKRDRGHRLRPLVAPFRINKDLWRRIKEIQSDMPF